MTDYLAPGISFALIGADAVVLDIGADRYYRLGGSRACALRAVVELGEALPPADRDALIAAHILTNDGEERIEPVTAAKPCVSILERPSTWDAEKPHLYRSGSAQGVIAARIGAGIAMRIMGLAPTISRWRGYRSLFSPLVRDEELATQIASGYAARRRWVPLKRRCVPDSLALVRCLWRRGVDADVFFGVRLDPFAAHAWVQTETIVLSDPLDSVAEFVPIFRL